MTFQRLFASVFRVVFAAVRASEEGSTGEGIS
jgi:hypothetical protein